MRERRFSAIPVIVTVLKVIAVLVLLFFVYQFLEGVITTVAQWKGGVSQYGVIPPVHGFWTRLASLIGPFFSLILGLLISALTWGFAEVFNMIRDLVITGTRVEPATGTT